MTTPFRSCFLLLSVVGVLLVAATACWAGRIHSDLLIEPGKQFVLGGEQRGAFTVTAYNKSTVPITIKERARGGSLSEKTTLVPRQRATLSFGAGAAAVLSNASTQQANLDLRITGDTNLRMESQTPASR